MIHPEARAEVLAAPAYYDELDALQGTALALDLQQCIVEAFVAIEEAPSSFPPYVFGTRRYLLRRFPYALVFDAEPAPVVLALAHAKRRPGYWAGRSADG